MAKYKFKYWYEWGERDCFLWADDDTAKKAFKTDVSYIRPPRKLTRARCRKILAIG